MVKFLLKIAANSAAIYVAGNLVQGFTFSGNLLILAGVVAALTIVQLVIYPVVKTIAFPIVILSFGLFGVIINAAALWAISLFVPQLSIEGIVPLLFATAILSVVNLLFSWL